MFPSVSYTVYLYSPNSYKSVYSLWMEPSVAIKRILQNTQKVGEGDLH